VVSSPDDSHYRQADKHHYEILRKAYEQSGHRHPADADGYHLARADAVGQKSGRYLP
jgi:hypothetical protein